MNNYNRNKKCNICKKLISDYSIRCNSCAKIIHGQTRIEHYCQDCDKKLSDYRHKRCMSCEAKLRHKKGLYKGKNAPNYINGCSLEPYPLEWNNKNLKELIRNRDRRKCQICGCPEVECNKKLHVHHIDYDKNNLNLTNLISLCHSCHIKTNFNRNYWIKYFEKVLIKI